MLTAFAHGLVRHRVRWSLAAAALFAASIWLGSRLGIRQEVSDFLPSGTATRDTLPLPGRDGDRLIVVLESAAPLTADQAGPVLDTLANHLTAIPGLDRLEYRVTGGMQRFLDRELPARLLLYFAPAELDSLRQRLGRDYIDRALLGTGPSIPRSDLGRALGIERTDPIGVIGPAVARIRTFSSALPVKTVGGYFATPDQRSYFAALMPTHRLSTIESARAMVHAVDSVMRLVGHRPGLTPLMRNAQLYVTGRPMALVAGVAIAIHDIQRVGIATTVVVFLMLVLFLRRVMGPLLMIGTVLYGVAVTSALAYLIYGSISLVSWLFIVSLIGFGDEFALYVVAHYWITAPGHDRADALASALRRPGPGILLGGITSAAAFFSLIAISYPIMRQVAWLTTGGLLLILACSFTVLPLALAFTRPGRYSDNGWHRWGNRAYRAGRQRRGWWIAGWITMLVASAWLARGLRFDLHPWKLAVRGVPATAALDQLSQRLGASFTPFTVVSRGPTIESALATERAAVRQLDSLKDDAGIAAVVALSRWVPPRSQQDSDIAYLHGHRDAFNPARFVREFTAAASRMPHRDSLLTQRYAPLVARYLDADPVPVSIATLDSAGMGEFVQDHLVRQPRGYLLRAEIYLTQVPWADGAVERFTRTLARDRSGALAHVAFFGDALRSATRVSVLRRDMLAVTALALGLTVLVLVVRFRRADLVLLCLVPLVCGVAAALAALALLH
ncbi:MAG: MMPL family transporter, partial [Gemmatimonadales bacterium]